MSTAAEIADRWPYLLLLLAMWVLLRWGKPLSAWVRDRRRPHPSIDQASHDRGPVPGEEET